MAAVTTKRCPEGADVIPFHRDGLNAGQRLAALVPGTRWFRTQDRTRGVAHVLRKVHGVTCTAACGHAFLPTRWSHGGEVLVTSSAASLAREVCEKCADWLIDHHGESGAPS